MKWTIGIDATRALSGGGINHITNIISSFDIDQTDIKEIHLWSHDKILKKIPNPKWLTKHITRSSSYNIILQLLWQKFILPRELTKVSCDIVLNVDAGTLNTFQPSVMMSRDMLSFEPLEMKRYRYGKKWLRLLALKYIQSFALKRASCAVFLTDYASQTIQNEIGQLDRFKIIPHGLNHEFKNMSANCIPWPNNTKDKIKFIYVSHWTEYKHHEKVLEAFDQLISEGYHLELTLIGTIDNVLFDKACKSLKNPASEWLVNLGHVEPSDLPKTLTNFHIFLFASSCENMPNTLLEGMALGLPIVCSDKRPMTDILGKGGSYFNPEDSQSIANCVKRVLTSESFRSNASKIAIQRSKIFSWERCSLETFQNLELVASELS
jgi:glycosyltransferase involved in cell wall biosynthesis